MPLSLTITASLIAGCDHTTPPPSAAPIARTPAPSSDAVTCSDGNTVDFTKATPPIDIDASKADNEGALAAFAWQHFIALNWPAAYPRTRERGTPDRSVTSFVQPRGSDITTVWESYRNKNEMFPAGASVRKAKPETNYNAPPVYHYDNGDKPNGEIGPCDDGKDPNRLVNLDENSQLGLAYMFAQPPGAPAPQQVMFLAKVNQVNYDYIVSNALYDERTQDVYARDNTTFGYYGMCQQTTPLCASASAGTLAERRPDGLGDYIPGAGSLTGKGNHISNPPAYCLPCGGTAPVGAPPQTSEGSIHVKAAWRRLTPAEAASGEYLTAPVVIYKQLPNKKLCYSNDQDQKWGLVGLHIIHKTVNFPQFFFATWEHVDNLASGLSYMNTATGGPTNTVGKRLAYQRAQHDGSSLPSATVRNINTCVQNAIKSSNPASVWQHYQLVGVQGKPVDYAAIRRPGVLPSYYLANNVIESNDFFQSFLGSKGKYRDTKPPALPDGYYIAPNLGFRGVGVTVNGGGCQGCHGNSQTQRGFDMSFLSAGFSDMAEAINEFNSESLRLKYLEMIRPPAP